MEIIYILLPITLLITFGFLVAFIFSVQKGQFDDLDSPAHQILDEHSINTKTSGEAKNDK